MVRNEYLSQFWAQMEGLLILISFLEDYSIIHFYLNLFASLGNTEIGFHSTSNTLRKDLSTSWTHFRSLQFLILEKDVTSWIKIETTTNLKKILNILKPPIFSFRSNSRTNGMHSAPQLLPKNMKSNEKWWKIMNRKKG